MQLARDRPLHVFLHAQRAPRQRAQLLAHVRDFLERASIRRDEPRAGERRDEQEPADEEQDFASDSIVDVPVGAGRFLLDLIVDDEELRDQAVDRAMLRHERSTNHLSCGRLVGATRLEHAIHVSPERSID